MAAEALEFFEIDALGLDTMDVRILTALCQTFRGRPVGLTTVASAVSEDPIDRMILRSMIEKFGGGPVGLDTLAAATGEDTITIEDVYEPYLLQRGLIVRTPQGRQATLAAFDHLGIEPPPAR